MSNALQKTAENKIAADRAEQRFTRPRVDVFENEAEYLVVADLPGVAKDAVEIKLDRGELVIEARRDEAQDATPLAQEFRPSSYRRVFALPDGIEAEAIDASLANGVLSVKLPKPAAKRVRRIEVRG